MNEIIVTKGNRVVKFVRVEEDKYSVIDENSVGFKCATMTRKKLLEKVNAMV